MKRVMLTGASGFIGRQTVPYLLAAGFEVHAAGTRPIEGLREVMWHTVDLLDASSARRLVAAVQPSHVLHLAWHVPPGQFWTSLENVRWVQASVEILLAFAEHGGRRWVSAGSCAEYDWSGSGTCQEDETPLAPATLYGACKGALHSIQLHVARQAGFSVATGRVFHVYGPYEPPARLAPSVIRALLRGEAAPCTHGRQIRDFLHVEDVARAFVTILDSECESAVNIGAGVPTSIRHVVETIASEIGRMDLLSVGALAAPPNDPACLVPDTSRLCKLGFVPKYGLDEGLRHTIAWWRSVTSH